MDEIMHKQKIIDFMRQFYLEKGVPPSHKEIAQHCKCALHTVTHWLSILVGEGKVRKVDASRGHVPVGYKVVRESEVYSP